MLCVYPKIFFKDAFQENSPLYFPCASIYKNQLRYDTMVLTSQIYHQIRGASDYKRNILRPVGHAEFKERDKCFM